MLPGKCPIQQVFLRVSVGILAVFGASPAIAQVQAFTTSQLLSTTPFVITLGAVLFGAVATVFALNQRRQNTSLARFAETQLAELSAALDQCENILNGMSEVTVVWHDPDKPPSVLGQVRQVIGHISGTANVTDYDLWLKSASVVDLKSRQAGLLEQGNAFDEIVTGSDNQFYRICGKLLAGCPVLRISRQIDNREAPYILPSSSVSGHDIESFAPLLDYLAHPAWIRNLRGQLVHVNAAYRKLITGTGSADGNEIPELFTPAACTWMREAAMMEGVQSFTDQHPELGSFDLTGFRLVNGTAGYAVRGYSADKSTDDRGASFLMAAIDELRTPVAVFDGGARLTHYNTSFAQFWELDTKWLDTQPGEKAILDRLRTRGQLPLEPDYKKWRSRHLSSYGLDTKRESMWHLPSGQVLTVIAAPAPSGYGVIYVYQNVTEKLALESRYNSLIQVQDETLNALREAVAVFGTDGRLKLFNTQLSGMWKIPLNVLNKQIHVSDIVNACAKAFPEDGRILWEELKTHIVDISADRSNRSGRIARADSRMIDYSVVRLPDGQSLVNFEDVTETCNYERVLKERNEALETADKLKDAFVHNVSYEFRSPLTNIIGFADLLTSGEAGALNTKQTAYANYIRASSATLGLLIDNILDLATIDAGIAEMHPEQLDIQELVHKAASGVSATLQSTGSDAPVNLDIDVAPGLPTFVADGGRIVQILYNLLSNAIRFSEPGARVKLTVSERGGRILFAVEDEGEGIPDDVISSVFDRFEGRAIAGRQRGAGLGLTIVRAFANMHGGVVNIERRKPKGTCVTVNLPPRQAVAGAAE